MASTLNAAAARTGEFADQAGRTAEGALRSTQRLANTAYDSVTSKLSDVREQAGPTLTRLSSDAETLARRGLDAVLDSSEQVRERALRATEDTVDYIKDEPFKAILIAAAAGAAVMALIALLSRPRA